jgi:adenine phosphoribosyltransferase
MSVPQSDLKELIRTIPDFPKPGIQFRDVTTLLNHPKGLSQTIDSLAEHFAGFDANKVVAIESRGFTIGGALAQRLGCGLVLARKKGKLPGNVERIEYDLEYGKDCIEIHSDAIEDGDRCIVIDDLLATGGTCAATCTLVERLQGEVVGCGFIVNLPELSGSERLKNYDLHWLVEFEGH